VTALREWIVRLRNLVRPDRRDADLEEELRAHLALAADAGAPPPAGLAQSMDACRDQRGVPWLDDLARDVRHGLRALRRSPAFTSAALLTLTIGIAANTAVFSLVNAVLLRPLPYPDADRLVAVWHTAPGAQGLSAVSGDLRLSPSMYVTYFEQNRAFEHIGTWSAATSTVTGVGEPEQVRTVRVADGTLQALAVPPIVGRIFAAVDHRIDSPQTVLLGYGYWMRRFGGDASVVGRRIVVDSVAREIVGVMPERFRVVNADADLIVPARLDRSRLILPGFGFQAVARLKPGLTIADANADIARLVPLWMSSWPAAGGVNPRIYETWRITPAVRPLKDDVVGGAGRSLWVLMATIGIVLLIACANVATLLLVRIDARQQELAIRTALGAGAGRIVRALLVESLLLSAAGGAAGLGAAALALRLFVAHAPQTLPRLGEVAIDLRAIAFTALVSLAAGFLFGGIAAVKHASPDVAARLAGRTVTDARERHRARNTLVVAQLALAFVLLVGAGLMIRTLRALHAVEPGFTSAESLQTMRIAIPPSLVSDPERVTRMQQAILDRAAALPGVRGAAFASEVAMEGLPKDWDAVFVEQVAYGADEIPPLRIFKQISPGFFQTIGARLVAGRDYTWTDLYGRRPVVIVSENFARELFGSPAAAIGRRIRTALSTATLREIVGVVQDVSENGVQEPAPAIVYWPAYTDSPYLPQPTATRTATFVFRSARAGTESFARELQQTVWSIDPNLAFASMRTLREIYDGSMARTTFTLVMLAVAGTMALALGIVGIYGVIAYAVAQRTREIGIRVALGAESRALTRMFVRSGLRLAGIGVPIGLAASAILTRVMASLLFRVTALDPLTYLAVPLLVVLAAAAASYVPAKRASALDPVEALKIE